MSGTSMATSFVSGVATLLWSHKPRASASDIWSALIEGAQDLGQEGRDIYYGHGLVQAKDSLAHLDPTYFPSLPPRTGWTSESWISTLKRLQSDRRTHHETTPAPRKVQIDRIFVVILM
mmetsp:Transcript_21467/g.49543  ORF Transcript_21467/g.49543 Transcript_21467/m.49543 type:complete len:119 (-) Transcript_21467:34-390(-)